MYRVFCRCSTVASAIILEVFAASASGQTSPISPGAVTVRLTQVATLPGSYGTPQDLVPANDGTNRMFITARNGDVLSLNNGSLQSTPFLNMPAAGINLYTGGEGGLLGIAASPTFNVPGTFGYDRFYTVDTEPFSTSGPAADFSHPELFPTTSTAPNNQIVVREWTTSSPTATTANTTSRVLMRINHPETNHQGGSLRFGPDGNLYLGLGDGGGANDFNGSPTSTTDGHTNSTGNGQDTTNVFGKILRFNPNPAAGAGYISSANGQYSIPNTNAFALSGGSNVKEIYAYGLRNPYRMSFDSATGKLYIGNVGQANRESVDVLASGAGGSNFGWPYYEGTRNNSADAGRTIPVNFTYTHPVAEYTHGDGEAVIGGAVYHGTDVPSLEGKYVFGDLGGASNNTVGRLFYMDPSTGSGPYPISALNYDTSANGITPSSNLYGFGQGAGGQLYAFFSNGDILQVVPEPSSLAVLGGSLTLLTVRPPRRQRLAGALA